MNRVSQQILKRLRRAGSLGDTPLPDDFVLPAYGGYSLANVPATVLAHFGVSGVPTPPLAPEVVGDELKGCRKLVVMLMDALGYLAVSAQMAGDRGLGLNALRRRGRFVPLTSVFPSTTAVALTTLHTGLPPVGHGITGYRMYLPDRGCVANMIRLSPEADERANRLVQHPGAARALLGVPTVHRLLTRAGVRSYCLIRDTIHRSGLSMMHYEGATEVIPFVNSSDLFVQIRKLLEADPQTPACIWAYWGALDTILHHYGTLGEEPEAEVRNLAYSLQRELLEPGARSGRGRAALMFLSDHGHIQVEAKDVVSIRKFPKWRKMLAVPPTGTGRSACLYLRDGRAASARGYLKVALGDRALVLMCGDALSEGLWGPGRVSPRFQGRVGELLVLFRDAHTLFYPYREEARPSDLVGGRHGGLHEREMLVPFFCTKL